jgi:hypothetical protein
MSDRMGGTVIVVRNIYTDPSCWLTGSFSLAVLVRTLRNCLSPPLIYRSLKWVEANPDINGYGGGGGPTWVEEHIEAWINVAGSLLGENRSFQKLIVSADFDRGVQGDDGVLIRRDARHG